MVRTVLPLVHAPLQLIRAVLGPKVIGAMELVVVVGLRFVRRARWPAVNGNRAPHPVPANPDPRRALERMFEALIRRTSDPRFPRGCLITNTSLECPGCGDDITRKILASVAKNEKHL